MLLQSVVTGAKKFLVHDKITACAKEIVLLGVVCKVSNRKTLSGETFCFPEKRLPSILNFVLRVTYCFFTGCWLANNQPAWNVLLFFCNPIGQLCLSGPGYSCRTVRQSSKWKLLEIFWYGKVGLAFNKATITTTATRTSKYIGETRRTTAMHLQHVFWYISLTSTARLRSETF